MDSTTYTTDTSAEAFDVQLECFRRMSPQERIQRMCAWSNQLKKMALEAIHRCHPEFSDQQVRLKFIEITYGEDLARRIGQWMENRNLGRAE
jgi:hypothetical protein